jgi:hypothetical protein
VDVVGSPWTSRVHVGRSRCPEIARPPGVYDSPQAPHGTASSKPCDFSSLAFSSPSAGLNPLYPRARRIMIRFAMCDLHMREITNRIILLRRNIQCREALFAHYQWIQHTREGFTGPCVRGTVHVSATFSSPTAGHIVCDGKISTQDDNQSHMARAMCRAVTAVDARAA